MFVFVVCLFDVTPFLEGKGNVKIPVELKVFHHVSLAEILFVTYSPNVTLE